MAQRRLARQPKQAKIDWTNPLTRGLVMAYSGGREYVKNRVVRINTGVAPKVDSMGFVADTFAQPGTDYVDFGDVIGNSGPVTLLLWMNNYGGDTYQSSCLAYGDWAVLRTQNFEGYTYDGTSWQDQFFSVGYPGAGIYKLAFMHAGTTNTVVGLYPGSTGFDITSNACNPRGGPLATLRLGADSVNGRSFNGTAPVALAFNRALSVDESRRLLLNPWQIFDNPTRVSAFAALGADTPINPGAGSLAITGYAPTVAQSANQALTAGAGSLALTGYAPTVARTANQALTAGVGSLALTGYAPTVAQSVNQAVVPGVGSITFTGYAPAVTQSSGLNLTPGVGSISFTGYAPALTQTANQAVAPGVGSLAITGYAPTIAQPQSVLPSAGTLAISGYAPTVAQTANQGLVAGAGVLALTGYAPSLTQTANQALVPGVGALTITGYAPTVVQASSSISANPGAGVLTITGYAPDVYQTGAAAANYEDKKKRRKKIELAMLRAEMEAERMPILKAPVLTVEHDDDEEVLMLLL